jgi:NADH-quinone oxidoreductase subunit L
MTSFYSWRLIFMTYHGKARGDHHTHEQAHESPRTKLVPLGVLAAGTIFAGMIWYNPFFGDHERMNAFFGLPAHAEADAGDHGEVAADDHGEAASEPTETTVANESAEAEPGHEAAAAPEADHAAAAPHGAIGAVYFAPDNTVIDDAHHAPVWVKVSPFVAMLIGLAIAYWFYILDPSRPKVLAESQPVLYRFLLNKWYFDEIYNAVFVRPAMWLGTFLWKKGDGATIDGGIIGLAMGIVPFFTRLAGRAQSGYLFHYALAMVLGLVFLTLWLAIRSAGQ